MKRLGVGLVLSGLQYAGGGDVDEGAGVALLEEVVGCRRVGILGEQFVEVVVVDEAGVNFARGNGGRDVAVALVGLDVIGLHVLKPLSSSARRRSSRASR